MATNPRRANGSARDRLCRRVLAEEDRCWICGQPVDKDLRGTCHPMAPEVDEIVPVSAGGDPLDRGNVRLAHRICNVRRGNRPVAPKVTRLACPTSREW
ncbi:HNH endonuclease [Atopobiaceae bacterium 24-176]